MKGQIRTILVAATLAVSAASAGASVTLVTPFADSFMGQITECVVTNFADTPATVTVGLFDINGSLVSAAALDTCNGTPLAPGTTCLVHGDVGRALCRIVASTSKVHAALEVFDTDTARVQVIVPATKP